MRNSTSIYLRYSHTIKWQKYGFYLCPCGVQFVARISAVNYGNTKSCGCSQGEKHGEAHKTPEYTAWAHMIGRCFQETNRHWPDYGGRGITVCTEWRNSYMEFLAHVGRRPSPVHSLDRINNDGNYEPGNVRWATKKEQANNRRWRSVWKKAS